MRLSTKRVESVCQHYISQVTVLSKYDSHTCSDCHFHLSMPLACVLCPFITPVPPRYHQVNERFIHVSTAQLLSSVRRVFAVEITDVQLLSVNSQQQLNSSNTSSLLAKFTILTQKNYIIITVSTLSFSYLYQGWADSTQSIGIGFGFGIRFGFGSILASIVHV